jgi:hypothetical protein
MESATLPLSSRLPRRAVGAQPRDLRFCGPFLEMFFTRNVVQPKDLVCTDFPLSNGAGHELDFLLCRILDRRPAV